MKKIIVILLFAVLSSAQTGCRNHTPSNTPGFEVASERLDVVPPISQAIQGYTYDVSPNWVTKWTFDSIGNLISEEKLSADPSSGDIDYSSYWEFIRSFDRGTFTSSWVYGGISWLYGSIPNADIRAEFETKLTIHDYVILRSDDILRYYDGEIGIIRNIIYSESELGSYEDYSLIDANGNILLDGYDFLAPYNYQEETPAEFFLGARADHAELLDRAGNIVKSVELPGVARLFPIGVGLYSYGKKYFPKPFYSEEIRRRSGNWRKDERWIEYTVGLLGSNLEVLIPDGTYIQILLQKGYAGNDGVPVELLQCRKYMGQTAGWTAFDRTIYTEFKDNYRTDIFTTTGELLIENLTDVYQIGPDRIGVVRGGYAGIMDWKGNWIVKKPIYTEFFDD